MFVMFASSQLKQNNEELFRTPRSGARTNAKYRCELKNGRRNLTFPNNIINNYID